MNLNFSHTRNSIIDYLLYYKKLLQVQTSGLNVFPSNSNFTRKSDTCFLLASGTSILKLQDSDFDEIRKNDSFSINYFLLHDFVPSFYYLELDPIKVKFLEETLDYILSKNKASPTVLFINNEGVELPFIKNLIKKYPSIDIYITCYRRLSGGDFNLLVRRIRFSLNLGGMNLLIHQGGSLAYLIFLSLYLGYKNTVVVGADGFTPGHFYMIQNLEATSLHSKVRDYVECNYAESVSPTIDLSINPVHKSSIGMFTMLDVVGALYESRDILASKYDFSLSWFSPGLSKTTLSDFFPEYNFSTASGPRRTSS